jgi:hypothetical protein
MKGAKMLIGNVLVRLAAIATIVIGIVSYAEAREESVNLGVQIALVANAAQATESVEGAKSALEANSNAGTKTTQESDSFLSGIELQELKLFLLPLITVAVGWCIMYSGSLAPIAVFVLLVTITMLYGIEGGKYDTWIIIGGVVGTFITIVLHQMWVSRDLDNALAEAEGALAAKEAKEAKQETITDAKAKG